MIIGPYPVEQPNLHAPIGEQFGEVGGRSISSCGWQWETIGTTVAEHDQVGMTWTDREGVGIVLLGFLNPADTSTFIERATSLVDQGRVAIGIVPAEHARSLDGGQISIRFEKPVVACWTCSTTITQGDSFCVGCGAPVARREPV